jgi:hypothetical protein
MAMYAVPKRGRTCPFNRFSVFAGPSPDPQPITTTAFIPVTEHMPPKVNGLLQRKLSLSFCIMIVGSVLFLAPLAVTWLGCLLTSNSIGCYDLMFLFLPVYPISIPMTIFGAVVWRRRIRKDRPLS